MTVKTERFDMRVSPEFMAIIDNWRRNSLIIPSRAEAIREMAIFGISCEDKFAEIIYLAEMLLEYSSKDIIYKETIEPYAKRLNDVVNDIENQSSVLMKKSRDNTKHAEEISIQIKPKKPATE